MAMHLIDYAQWLTEWNKIRKGTPPPFRGCLEAIDASLWLIAGYRIPQALVILVNSIELAFKAALEEIDHALVFDSNGKEHSINFWRAMDQVEGLYGSLVVKWRKELEASYRIRNEIIHYGVGCDEFSHCAEVISTVCFPFLDEFLLSVPQVSLERLLTPGVYREINVAKRTCERLNEEGEPSVTYVLDTVALQVLSTFAERPSPEKEKIVGEYEFALASEMAVEIRREWFDDWSVETLCRICNYWPAFVKVRALKIPVQYLIPLAVRCPKCGLDISEEQKYLAEYHVGNLEPEIVSEFFKEHGEYVEE